MANNDKVAVWGGVPRIARTPSSKQLLVGNGDGFTLTNSYQNMEVTTSGGEPYYGFAGYHGAFESHANQTLDPQGSPVAGTTTLVKYDTTNLSYGVSIVNNTQLKVTYPGVYNFQFSLQIVSGVNNKQAYVWLKYNGSDVAYSNTEIDLSNKDYGYVASWNFLYQMNANDYLELAWTSNDITTYLRDGVAIYGPNIPSVIATITLVR